MVFPPAERISPFPASGILFVKVQRAKLARFQRTVCLLFGLDSMLAVMYWRFFRLSLVNRFEQTVCLASMLAVRVRGRKVDVWRKGQNEEGREVREEMRRRGVSHTIELAWTSHGHERLLVFKVAPRKRVSSCRERD